MSSELEREPCFVTRKDTPVAEDVVIPYGGWVGISSEEKSKEIAEELANANWPNFK